MDNNVHAFFELVKSGLWENSEFHNSRSMLQGDVDWEEVYRLASEQAVLGLVLAGIERLKNANVNLSLNQELLLQWIGEVQIIEQRNHTMNSFIGRLVEKMRKENIYTLLVKGQGVAQCYEKPLWRTLGDVDFYLSESNYKKAKEVLAPMAQTIDTEDKERRHLAMTIDEWCVELHGTMHTDISNRMNIVLDEVHRDIFYNGSVRSWQNDRVQVFLPSADNDVCIIFTHFINHFFAEGVGLRQICDWCRTLWTYKDVINVSLLENRLGKMSLMTEWKSFAYFAGEYLGMPVEAMPFYENKSYFRKKARKISELIIETGSFGSNKDNSYRINNNRWKVYFRTFVRRLEEFCRVASIFPYNAPKFFLTYIYHRINKTVL